MGSDGHICVGVVNIYRLVPRFWAVVVFPSQGPGGPVLPHPLPLWHQPLLQGHKRAGVPAAPVCRGVNQEEELALLREPFLGGLCPPAGAAGRMAAADTSSECMWAAAAGCRSRSGMAAVSGVHAGLRSGCPHLLRGMVRARQGTPCPNQSPRFSRSSLLPGPLGPRPGASCAVLGEWCDLPGFPHLPARLYL